MKKESKIYKIYLILLGVSFLISFALGYLVYRDTVPFMEDLDNIYDVIENGDDESKENVINNFNEGIEKEEDKYDVTKLKESIERYRDSDVYKLISEGKDSEVISIYATQYLCIFHGFMLIAVLAYYLEKRFLKGLNKPLRILLTVVILIFIAQYRPYIMAIGSIGLPIAIVYCIYKIKKTKNNNTNEKVPDEDVVEVQGKVDADEALKEKNTK